MKHFRITSKFILIVAVFVSFCACKKEKAQVKPNIILVMSDDQGYGDLSLTGNPWLKTPNIDKLAAEGTSLTDFHVSPCCAPTRAALLSGHYTNRTGCWHTVGGRSLVKESETLLPQILSENGYSTAMYGKWHLGDNFPFRPQDKGFQEVLMHMGGGVGQQPDYWENDYFNDTYFHNGKPEKQEGYCTDIWFKNAMNYIDEKASAGEPFFVYLSTNAPHGPYYCADKYSDLYKDVEGVVNPYYYGMIANLDENMGKLEAFLDEKGLADNTILIFLTDNGVAHGSGMILDHATGLAKKGYNAGMRGGKISEYEGGHRVPFFIRWPKGGIRSGTAIDELTAHIDVVPTLLDFLQIKSDIKFDGTSLKSLLLENKELEDRSVVVDNQRVDIPVKWKNSSVMNGKWRLVDENQLYNITSDPGQQNNIADQHPDLVKKLAADYEKWWADIEPGLAEYPAIAICPAEEPITLINTMDMHPDVDGTKVPWNQDHIREVVTNNGWYAVNVLEEGDYKVSLYRYPPESGLAIAASASATIPEEGTNVNPYGKGKKLEIVTARVSFDDLVMDGVVDALLEAKEFNVHLQKGWQKMRAEFFEKEIGWMAAYYIKLEKINN